VSVSQFANAVRRKEVRETLRRTRLPVSLLLRASHQHLQIAEIGDALLLIGIAALEEVRLIEEIAALSMEPHGRQSLRRDQHLDLAGFGSFARCSCTF